MGIYLCGVLVDSAFQIGKLVSRTFLNQFLKHRAAKQGHTCPEQG